MPVILVTLLLLAFSVILRMKNKQRAESHELPEHVKRTPFSEALQELISQAGGIYLTLVLLFSFLKIELAQKWNIYGVEMDPAAFMALTLAFFQPIVLRMYRSVIGG